jgi:hypothetical protein
VRLRPGHPVPLLALLVGAVLLPLQAFWTAGADSVSPAAVAAPRAPAGVHATGTTGTSVALVWNSVSGAVEYQVRRDGASPVTATIPSAMIVGLTPSTAYTLRVRAKDRSGGWSPDSAPYTVTTGSDPGGGGGKVAWAGVRSSNYGISPFPNPCGWTKAIGTMRDYFPGSTGAGVWIVGHLSGNGVQLEFPRPDDGRNYGSRIKFSGSDKHERYLDYFDSRGIKVWLQVESGFADIPTLVDLVLKRYRHHPSVVGFGVDVEWFNPRGADLNDPVTDELAQRWDAKVTSYGPAYSLFLKHFDQSAMPPTYRGQIVFVDDSQELRNIDNFLAEMKAWADRYYPNPVMYQVGYDTDQAWWSKEAKPVPKTLGTRLATVTRQDFGVAWVDFTLRSVLPTSC